MPSRCPVTSSSANSWAVTRPAGTALTSGALLRATPPTIPTSPPTSMPWQRRGGSTRVSRGTTSLRPRTARTWSRGSGSASVPLRFEPCVLCQDHPYRGRAEEVEVRLSRAEDLHQIAALARELPIHLQASPSFSELAVESEEALRDEWRDTWERGEYTHFVAELGGRIVGQLLTLSPPRRGSPYPVEQHRPLKCDDVASASGCRSRSRAPDRGDGVG